MYISFGSSFLSSSSDHIANTGGFVGPYSVLLPDTDETVAEGERPTTYMRYVKSLSSELLKQPLNYNITTDDNSFNKMFGQIAINNTIKHQTMDDTVNPFADYVGKDCSYGNVAEKLILCVKFASSLQPLNFPREESCNTHRLHTVHAALI